MSDTQLSPAPPGPSTTFCLRSCPLPPICAAGLPLFWRYLTSSTTSKEASPHSLFLHHHHRPSSWRLPKPRVWVNPPILSRLASRLLRVRLSPRLVPVRLHSGPMSPRPAPACVPLSTTRSIAPMAAPQVPCRSPRHQGHRARHHTCGSTFHRSRHLPVLQRSLSKSQLGQRSASRQQRHHRPQVMRPCRFR